jgi:hypothetical protein
VTPALSATFRQALTFLTAIHCVTGSYAALIAIEPADPLGANAVCYASDRKGHDQYERGHGQRITQSPKAASSRCAVAVVVWREIPQGQQIVAASKRQIVSR